LSIVYFLSITEAICNTDQCQYKAFENGREHYKSEFLYSCTSGSSDSQGIDWHHALNVRINQIHHHMCDQRLMITCATSSWEPIFGHFNQISNSAYSHDSDRSHEPQLKHRLPLSIKLVHPRVYVCVSCCACTMRRWQLCHESDLHISS
jgi:hypothetical protein